VVKANERRELIRGIIVALPVRRPVRQAVLSRLSGALTEFLPATDLPRIHRPLLLRDSVPYPDLVCAREISESAYLPAKRCNLVVEVSDARLAENRRYRLALYAENKIAVYWIVNLVDGVVEVYTQPKGGKKPGYKAKADYAAGDGVPVVLGGKPVGTIPVSEIIL
jgi:hypothetical protein